MKKKAVSLLTCGALTLSLVTPAIAAPSDLNGHWAEDAMNTWMDYGVIHGYEDGTVKPNNSITRGELAVMLDRMMGYQTQANNTFSDLGDNWYTDAILGANKAGIIGGYANGTVKPNVTITRQEAVVMIARALSLSGTAGASNIFTDSGEIAPWALDAINAMVDAGYIHGSNGAFRPDDGITRAEVVTILDNIFGGFYQASGTYTENVDGSLVINSGDVSLDGITITGDLIIAEGVSVNSIVLDDVTVEGRIIVRGGGTGSDAVIIKGDSDVETVIVQRQDEPVEIDVQGSATVDEVIASTGTENVAVSGSVDTVTVDDDNTAVEINGTVNTLTVTENADNADVTVAKGARVGSVTTSADNTNMNVAGTVKDVTVAEGADNATVSTESGAKVDNVTTSGAGTTVEGNGTVSKVEAAEGSTDATVTTPGTKVENNGTGSVDTGKGEVKPGDTGTTPGGSSGGSSSGGSSHSHSYTDGVCSCGSYDPAWAQVNSAESWNAAVEANKNIVVTADFTANAQLKITKGMTVNGNNKAITAGTWTDGSPASKGEAPLVSVIAGENAVVIKNLTLTGTKTIDSTAVEDGVKDYGHGLNVYESSNVTLNNVTLSGNAGAGLVINSSTVNAVGLHTSDNGWGGVNVDKRSGEGASAASFTFDATSTFGEQSAVYSDGGNVTVNAPEGWASTTVKSVTVWAKLFDGGLGTEESPYEIATAEQFANIDLVYQSSTEFHYFNFTADVVLPKNTGSLYDGMIGNAFYGVIDGQGHSLTTDGQGYIIQNVMGQSVIRNLNVRNSGVQATMLVWMSGDEATAEQRNATKLTFENVNIYGADESQYYSFMAYRVGSYIYQPFSDVSFINCTNYMNIVDNNSTGIFVSNYPDTSNKIGINLVFDNCVNAGTVSAPSIGFLIGNSNSKTYALVDKPEAEKTIGTINLYISNCSNQGQLIATTGCTPINAVPASQVDKYAALNESICSDGKYSQGNVQLGTTQATLTVNDNQALVITTPEDTTNVTAYEISYWVSTSYSNGSDYFRVTTSYASDKIDTAQIPYISEVMLDTDYAEKTNSTYADISAQEQTDHMNHKYKVTQINGKYVAVVTEASLIAGRGDGDVTLVNMGSKPIYQISCLNGESYIGSTMYAAGALDQ